MTTGLPELPRGQEMNPGARPWRRLSYLPLVILAIVSLIALVVGGATGAELNRRASEPAAVAPAPSAAPDSVGGICRPPMTPTPPDTEPWIENRAASEATWQEHADEVSKQYFIGPNGWIFWSDYVDQYASQAVGRALLSEAQVQQWVDHLTGLEESLAAEGIEFYMVVTPSTSSIYPEELPLWMQDLRGSTIMDQVISATGDLPVIDLRADLIAQKDGPEHLFSWSNSHWTDYGGYVAWKQISSCVAALFPDTPSLGVPEISGAGVIGDFNEWAPFGVESPGADWTVPLYTQPLMEATRTDKDGKTETIPGDAATDLTILPAETTVADSWTGKSALIFRDSMGGALSPLWQQAYSPTWQVNQPYIAGYQGSQVVSDAVAAHDPDVVIVQLAERYLLNAPPQGAAY